MRSARSGCRRQNATTRPQVISSFDCLKAVFFSGGALDRAVIAVVGLRKLASAEW